ncbi:ABC transporter permease [Rhodococcus erythropolis]|uniref:ABC transporter permease n=1 Tax=Rhodococcus erythropolis TaxID=1833 RepID=A0A5N5DWR1_RHOER|nr:ABC transporter permease [Rhodococcus erythropolis]
MAVRLASGVIVVWSAVTIAFFVLRVLPGSQNVSGLIGAAGKQLTPEQIDEARRQLGLDRPLTVQYFSYLGNLLRGNLGSSYIQKQPVVDILAAPFLATLQLSIIALAVSWIMAVVWTLSTGGRRSLAESVGRVVEIVSTSLPQFWLGLMLLLVFGSGLHWFPVSGGKGFTSLVLPVLTLAIPLAGLIGQLTRGSFEDALSQPFMLSARARGLSNEAARRRHALRHALLPGLAFSGQAMGYLLGGALVVEQIFARPGIGRIIFQAVSSKDLPVVLGVVILVAVSYVVIGILIDILYRVVDPRIGQL